MNCLIIYILLSRPEDEMKSIEIINYYYFHFVFLHSLNSLDNMLAFYKQDKIRTR